MLTLFSIYFSIYIFFLYGCTLNNMQDRHYHQWYDIALNYTLTHPLKIQLCIFILNCFCFHWVSLSLIQTLTECAPVHSSWLYLIVLCNWHLTVIERTRRHTYVYYCHAMYRKLTTHTDIQDSAIYNGLKRERELLRCYYFIHPFVKYTFSVFAWVHLMRDRICGVMVSALASSAIYRGFEPR